MDVTLAQRPPSQALAPSPLRKPAAQFQELSYQSQERLDVTYSDSAGNAFHLTIERSTSLYAATYDRSGALGGRSHGHGRHARGSGNGLESLAAGLRDANDTARGFQRLLHRLLKAVDPSYAERSSGRERPAGGAGGTEVVAAAENVTVTLEVTGAPSSDYWSAENTAGRLVDFATALFRGGDRSAHAERMAAAMEQGYSEAEKAFGGALPAIARETVDLARERLQAWASAPQQMTPAVEPGRLDLAA
ncbi:MAG: hypothetical protein HZB55_15635 [Deltaproteobacteria bacterium]|nr:hypothetical protein [Deltaproteobacteria bacterium]